MRRFLRKIILGTNIAFAVFLMLSYLSRYINPGNFWLPAFLGLTYPYILVANFLFLAFWLLRKRKEFVISLLSVLLGWHTLTAYISLHPGALVKKQHFEHLSRLQREESRQIKLMSFNVRAFDRYGWADNPAAQDEILQLMQEEDPDIVCIQEFYVSDRDPHGLENIFQSLDKTPYRHLEFTAGNGQGGYGIATFSAYPIVNSGSIRFENTINISIYTDIRIGKDTLRIYNNHLQSIYFRRENYLFLNSLRLRYDNGQMEEIRDISYRLRDAFVKRARQAETIAAHKAECPYRLVVCGDFNDTPVSYTYYRLSEEMEDAFTQTGWGTGRTYNGKFPSFRIDYILHGKGLEPLFFTRKKVWLSDHFPIVSYLRID